MHESTSRLRSQPNPSLPHPEPPRALTFQEATSEFQRRFVEQMLLETGWNVSGAARRLGLARSHVYNLIHSFGLRRVAKTVNGDSAARDTTPHDIDRRAGSVSEVRV